jgi:hypothetical protein
MRSYGKVDTCFWTDTKIRNLSDNGKLFFLYLLSCPHSTPIGCYRLPVAYIAADLKWPQSTVTKTLTETLSKGLIAYDGDREIIWLINFFKHNSIDNPNVGKSCIPFIESVDRNIPFYHMVIESLKPFTERFPNGYINGLLKGMPNIEPNLTKPEPKPEPQPEPGDDFILPDWIDQALWNDFMEVRKKKEATNTPRAKTSLVRQLEKLRIAGHDPTDVIENSIRNSWKDVFEPKGKPHAATINSNQPVTRNDKPTWKSEGQRLTDKYRQYAEREEQDAISRGLEPALCIAEAVRQNPS